MTEEELATKHLIQSMEQLNEKATVDLSATDCFGLLSTLNLGLGFKLCTQYQITICLDSLVDLDHLKQKLNCTTWYQVWKGFLKAYDSVTPHHIEALRSMGFQCRLVFGEYALFSKPRGTSSNLDREKLGFPIFEIAESLASELYWFSYDFGGTHFDIESDEFWSENSDEPYNFAAFYATHNIGKLEPFQRTWLFAQTQLRLSEQL